MTITTIGVDLAKNSFRALLADEVEHLQELEHHLEQLDCALLAQARTDEACQRLTGVPGIGPVIATAMVAAVANKLARIVHAVLSRGEAYRAPA